MYRRVLSRAPLPHALQALPLCKASKAVASRVTDGERSCVARFVTAAQCRQLRQDEQARQQQRSPLPRSFRAHLGDVAEVTVATTTTPTTAATRRAKRHGHTPTSTAAATQQHRHELLVGLGDDACVSVRDYRAAVTTAVRRAQAAGAAGIVLVPPTTATTSRHGSDNNSSSRHPSSRRRTSTHAAASTANVAVHTQTDLFHDAQPLSAQAVVERTATFAVTAAYTYNRLRSRPATDADADAASSSSSSSSLALVGSDEAADDTGNGHDTHAARNDSGNSSNKKHTASRTRRARDKAAATTAATAAVNTAANDKDRFALLIDTNDTAAVHTGSVIGRCVNDARTLVNLRQDEGTPEFMVAWAQRALGAKHTSSSRKSSSRKSSNSSGLLLPSSRRGDGDVHIRALLCGEAIRRAGMQLLYNVGKGSTHAPYVLVLEYVGNPRRRTSTALVGKGVTFDSGGLNVKPYGAMETMHTDMAGAAVALCTLAAVAALRLPVNVVVGVGLVENALGADSYHPSCILTSLRGSTVEVLNTDAEGRLVLADVLTYIQRDAPLQTTPRAVIDVATLTGAVVAALGQRRAGVFGNDAALTRQLCDAGMHVGEELWPLPVGDEHTAVMRGHLADWANAARGSKYAGACTAAAFLSHFVERDCAWAHVDIAGTADVGDRPRAFAPAGGTGYGVQLLVEYLRRL